MLPPTLKFRAVGFRGTHVEVDNVRHDTPAPLARLKRTQERKIEGIENVAIADVDGWPVRRTSGCRWKLCRQLYRAANRKLLLPTANRPTATLQQVTPQGIVRSDPERSSKNRRSHP